MFGTTELIIILVILVFIFGLGKLPKAARQLGQSVKTFQDSVQGKDEEIDVGKDEESPKGHLQDQQADQVVGDSSMASQQKHSET